MISPFATLFTTTLLLTQSWATPLDFERRPHLVEDIAPLLRRQAQAPFNVAGVQGAGVASRLEIRQLQGNADQWNIFLLGLQRMQGMNQQDSLSYYQIAGRWSSFGIPLWLSRMRSAGESLVGMYQCRALQSKRIVNSLNWSGFVVQSDMKRVLECFRENRF